MIPVSTMIPVSVTLALALFTFSATLGAVFWRVGELEKRFLALESRVLNGITSRQQKTELDLARLQTAHDDRVAAGHCVPKRVPS